MLICKFVTQNSDEGRIRIWLDYLADLERRNADDAGALHMLQKLGREAHSWLDAARPRPQQPSA